MKDSCLYRGRLKKIAAVALAAAVSVASVQSAYASRKTQAQDAKNKAQDNLTSVTNDISSITKRQETLQKEINALDAELVNLLMNMDILSDELDIKEKEIRRADKDLKAAKKDEAEQYDRMKKRIRYMYEHGDESLLEALLGATSMADLLNRINYCNEVYDYDRGQLETYKETKQQVMDLKEQLEAEQSELQEMQQNYQEQEKELKKMVASKEATMDDFDSKLSEAKQLAAAYKETIQEQNQIIKEEEEKEKAAAEAEAARKAAEEAARKKAEEEARQAAAAAAKAAAAVAAQQQAQDNPQSAGSSSPADSSNPSSDSSPAPETADSSSSSSDSAPAVSSSGVTGSDVIAYATQFIGNPYVWGGTSLTNGADCSGFVMSVYAHFGYSLPHSSAAMASCGRGVSYSEAQPGDLICYSGHVALYMGGGMIVGAQSSKTGITTQTATYRTIIAVRRII